MGQELERVGKERGKSRPHPRSRSPSHLGACVPVRRQLVSVPVEASDALGGGCPWPALLPGEGGGRCPGTQQGHVCHCSHTATSFKLCLCM